MYFLNIQALLKIDACFISSIFNILILCFPLVTQYIPSSYCDEWRFALQTFRFLYNKLSSSFKDQPFFQVVDDVAPEDLNDDEEERNQLRIQEESNRRSQSIHSKRMSLAEKSISDKNVSEHFQSCIQLAAENVGDIFLPFLIFSFFDSLHVTDIFRKSQPRTLSILN